MRTKEQASDERDQRAIVDGSTVTYRGQRHKLGKAQKLATPNPVAGPNMVKARRLRLEEES